jgi:hypothetical protein
MAEGNAIMQSKYEFSVVKINYSVRETDSIKPTPVDGIYVKLFEIYQDLGKNNSQKHLAKCMEILYYINAK